MCRNTIGLYCDRRHGRWAGAGHAGSALGAQQAQAGRWGAQVLRRRRGRAGQAAAARAGHAAGARTRHGAPLGARGRATCGCDTDAGACETAGPGCDMARPRATIRPLCAPGRACVRLGVPVRAWVCSARPDGVFCAL